MTVCSHDVRVLQALAPALTVPTFSGNCSSGKRDILDTVLRQIIFQAPRSISYTRYCATCTYTYTVAWFDSTHWMWSHLCGTSRVSPTTRSSKSSRVKLVLNLRVACIYIISRKFFCDRSRERSFKIIRPQWSPHTCCIATHFFHAIFFRTIATVYFSVL